jgi:hypothetical protein
VVVLQPASNSTTNAIPVFITNPAGYPACQIELDVRHTLRTDPGGRDCTHADECAATIVVPELITSNAGQASRVQVSFESG